MELDNLIGFEIMSKWMTIYAVGVKSLDSQIGDMNSKELVKGEELIGKRQKYQWDAQIQWLCSKS